MTGKKKQGKKKPDLSWLEEDPLGLDEEIKAMSFRCLNCGKEDEAVVDEFGYGLGKGEEVEIECLYCGGTMRRARKSPK